MFDKLKQILSAQFGVPENEISKDTNIVNDLNADSVDIVEVIMTIEKAFKIAIDQEEYKGKTTVGLLLELIESKLFQSN